MIIGSFSEPAISSTRPIMTAGPMERNSKPFRRGSVLALGRSGVCVCAQTRPAMVRQDAAKINDNKRRFKIGARMETPWSDDGLRYRKCSTRRARQVWQAASACHAQMQTKSVVSVLLQNVKSEPSPIHAMLPDQAFLDLHDLHEIH